jgi:PKD repeat protein
MRLLATLALGISLIAQEKPALRIVVIQGEDAVNVIQQKTAVAPLVEVRDRNDQPVAGVPVTFAIAGKSASFGGAQTLTVTTNAAGRAAASGLTAVGNGPLQIQVSATFQGQTATAAISQTNVATAPAGSSAGAKAGGGGISGLAIGGISAVVIGGGAAIALSANKEDSTSSTTTTTSTATPPPASAPAPPANRPPVVSAISASRSVTIIGVPVTFSASASDPESDALTLSWEFGDGNGATSQSPSYTYTRAGVFLVRLTVRDRETASTSEREFTVTTVTGEWMHTAQPDGGGELFLSQNGTSITGHQRMRVGDSFLICAFGSGTVNPSSPHVVLDRPPCFPLPSGGAPFIYQLELSEDGNQLKDLRLSAAQANFVRR